MALAGKAMAGGNKWYFYSRITHENNRITSNGYWKPLGVDEPILSTSNHNLGMKKYYAFYMGQPPQGHKTNWLMQEYSHISHSSTSASSSRTRRSRSKIVYPLSFHILLITPSIPIYVALFEFQDSN